MSELIKADEADTEREKQRSESEARDIIHDIQRLYTFPEEKKTRWVWELLQNAKDVAGNGGVDVRIELEPERLEFTHNGLPFKTKHLLAILYKTSTKSLSGEGSTTGKYGTGFVTTHILSKKVKISGVHENEEGQRRFEIDLDRTAANLPEDQALARIQNSLSTSFNTISAITKKPAERIDDNSTTFIYQLKADAFLYAERGLLELQRNLAFTLLINKPRIRSVTVKSSIHQKSFVASDQQTGLAGIRFISLESDTGLLYKQVGKVIFGIPATKREDGYYLLPIVGQAILYKEFPLIGTEGFNLPVFVQHEDFHPTEQRDGIRTKIGSDEEIDTIADKNRAALTEFVKGYIPFMTAIIDAKFHGAYLFAKSGLPEFFEIFTNQIWWEDNIQKPIRDTILQKEIVTTCSGANRTIAQSKFILRTVMDCENFFELASEILPDQIPEKNSIWHWADIISQDSSRWPNNIILEIEDLVKQLSHTLNPASPSTFKWLNRFYLFLDRNQLTHLGEKYPIYLNEAGNFCTRDKVAIHPDLDDQFKIVAKGLGRPLENEFLNRKLGRPTGIKDFDLPEFFNFLNKDLISDLKVESASETETAAIFHICCLFRSDRALRRDYWFKIINQLVPTLSPEKKLISVEYENYWRSAELWSIKYLCHLLGKANSPTVLAKDYFFGNLDACFIWLNDFLEFVFELQEDSREVILKKRIIPTQSDEFKPYDDNIFREHDSEYFDDVIKDIYKTYTKKGDPRRILVNTNITCSGIRTREVSLLTSEIDNLFHDENIESKVKKGGPLSDMFLQLNDWYEKFSTSSTYLPTFSSKRTLLYVLALGEGFSKQIMEIQSSGKSIDDIKELAKIQLSAQEMRLFESAAAELGTSTLLAKAEEMVEAKRQIERWKIIGSAAEIAFKEALAFAQPNFELLNPDVGKDFVIVANGKEYAIEIKSVELSKGNVNMSVLQGKTSVVEKDRYALCVLTRPSDDRPVDKEYFIQESRFVPDIGTRIGNSIEQWEQGIKELDTHSEVKVTFDDKSESIYVGRDIWKNGISFNEMIDVLIKHFS